jgi:peptidoglycan/xylan/chitin deacetylase (PgdA/CDA1 family)
MKETLRAMTSRFLVASGATGFGRRLHDRAGTIILYGHRVADDDEAFFQGLPPRLFREQIEYVTRHYEVIPLSTLVACIAENRPPPPRSVVLTFDDGFRDNVENALPILDEFGAVATVFVVTESLSDGRLPWSQRIGFMFQKTRETQVQDDLLGPVAVTLAGDAQRRKAYAHMMQVLTPLDRRARDSAIERLAVSLDVEPPQDRMMTWDHARAMLAAGHGIGAHTYSHALLAEVPIEEAHWEMKRSLLDLEEHLGLRHPSFCFPAGRSTPGLRAVVRELGFSSCFVANPAKRLNRPGLVDNYSLVRVSLPNAPGFHLEAELEGPFHALRRFTGRYAHVSGR